MAISLSLLRPPDGGRHRPYDREPITRTDRRLRRARPRAPTDRPRSPPTSPYANRQQQAHVQDSPPAHQSRTKLFTQTTPTLFMCPLDLPSAGRQGPYSRTSVAARATRLASPPSVHLHPQVHSTQQPSSTRLAGLHQLRRGLRSTDPVLHHRRRQPTVAPHGPFLAPDNHLQTVIFLTVFQAGAVKRSRRTGPDEAGYPRSVRGSARLGPSRGSPG